MHEPGHLVGGVGIPVELQPLYQGRSAVPHPHDGHADLVVGHQAPSLSAMRAARSPRARLRVLERGGGGSPAWCRSAKISSSSHRMSVSVAESSWFISDSV